MASSFHLLVAIPDKEPISYSLSGESLTLGRSPVNDIQVLVREVSTSHCKFTQSGDGYEITDTGSTNGTKVNDQSVKNGKVSLNHHDVILFGETIPAYLVVVEEGASFDMKAEIAQIEKARQVPKKPTVQHLKAPGVAKKVSLPTKKPLTPITAIPTPADGPSVGSATIKLDQPQPGATPGAPAVKKLVPPGATPPPPPATKSPAPGPPAVKLAPPGPPAAKLAPPGAPTAKPAPPGPPAAKLAAPGPPPTVGPSTVKLDSLNPPNQTPAAGPPAVKLANPDEAPAKRIALPTKKAPPKLNLPDRED